jgi:hypothetical protein
MRDVSDAFLLNVAEVSATLLGLFLVGVFFYLETGLGRREPSSVVFQTYLRAGTKIVLVLYALPLFLSLTLVALTPGWNRVVFLLLSLILVAANVETLRGIRELARVSGNSGWVLTELLGTAAVVVLVALPWLLGGFHPTREDFTWSILLSFGTGFLSVGALILSVFDTARLEPGRVGGGTGRNPSRRPR